MEKKIKLQSRYKDVNTYLKVFNDNTGVLLSDGSYTLNISSDNILSEDNYSIQAVDFEGGPMLKVGDKIIDELGKIKTITKCYYVEFE